MKEYIISSSIWGVYGCFETTLRIGVVAALGGAWRVNDEMHAVIEAGMSKEEEEEER